MKSFPLIILCLGVCFRLFGATSLENAWVRPLGLTANDLVFDSTRDVLYLSVPSSAGSPYGNSIVTVDPSTGGIIHSSFVGSEPDKLAISSDGSRVYIGIDGADSFCWWDPATNTVGPLAYFTAPFGSGPYNAMDFAIDPVDPHTVVVSKDDISSSAAGDLELFHDNVSAQEMDLIYGAESICFSDAGTLIGYNNYDTGYDLWKWAFNGTQLTQTQHVTGVIAGFSVRIKSVDGLIFSDNGKVVSPTNLSPLGTFYGLPVSAAVEPIAGANIVYFLGSSGFSSGSLELACFDRKTYLQLDSKTFTNMVTSSISSLVAAGHDPAGADRLAFIESDGHAGIITITPPLFRVESFQSNGSSSLLVWPSDIGGQYQVQSSTDLRNWTTLTTTNATQFHTAVSFNSGGTSGHEFYRIVRN